jgi:hypothetical protein
VHVLVEDQEGKGQHAADGLGQRIESVVLQVCMRLRVNDKTKPTPPLPQDAQADEKRYSPKGQKSAYPTLEDSTSSTLHRELC